tara:strand:- start:17699 stop:18163 length:465 start_codon:yes stop_codon:yes gene_type:complete
MGAGAVVVRQRQVDRLIGREVGLGVGGHAPAAHGRIAFQGKALGGQHGGARVLREIFRNSLARAVETKPVSKLATPEPIDEIAAPVDGVAHDDLRRLAHDGRQADVNQPGTIRAVAQALPVIQKPAEFPGVKGLGWFKKEWCALPQVFTAQFRH